VRTVTLDQSPPVLTVDAPEDGIVIGVDTVVVSGSVTDATAVTVDANGVPLPVDGAGLFSGTISLSEGANVVTVTATDAAGNDAQVVRIVTVDTEAPVLVVNEPTDGSTTSADSVDVSGTVKDATEVTLTLNASALEVDSLGAFSTRVALIVGANTLAFLAADEAGNEAVDTVTVTRTSGGLPPEPSLVASVIPANLVSAIGAATAFLYEGPDSIQTGVAPGTIDPVRVVVLRGRVLDRDSLPVSGATVSIANQQEFGQTLTRADGGYDLALNGGGAPNVRFSKAEYAEVQRRLQLPWQDYVVLDDVFMTALDTAVTVINFSDPIEVAAGTPQTDGDGSRQATLMFRQGTIAVAIMPDASTDTLASISVRATEYTVGDDGPKAMPAELPPTSGYTYAVELSVDEALAAGAQSVQFSQGVPLYVENFLGFPVGGAVPAGYFDRQQGEWLAMPNGRVIEVVGIQSGVAELDITGDGVAESPATVLAAIGVTGDELVAIGSTYAVGDELWRVETTHFTPVDLNWPINPPPTTAFPDDPSREDQLEPDDPCNVSGSILACEAQGVGETIPVTGTPFSLNYSSLRAPGRRTASTVAIPVTGDSVPSGLTQVVLSISVAGRRFVESFPPDPNQSHVFEWDGFDAYGRELIGEHPIRAAISYIYPVQYQNPAPVPRSFGVPMANGSLTVSARVGAAYTAIWEGRVGSRFVGDVDAEGSSSLGGWTLDVHHGYDPIGGRLYLGDGTARSASHIGQVIETIAGNGGQIEIDPDGEVATQIGIGRVNDIAVAPDGRVALGDSTLAQVSVIELDGTLSTLVENVGTTGLDYGPDGSLWLAGGTRVHRLRPTGELETYGDSLAHRGDGGPVDADSVRFGPLGDVAAAPDGSVYVLQGGTTVWSSLCGLAIGLFDWCNKVRRIGPDGTLATVAGTGPGSGSTGDGGPARLAGLADAVALAVGPDGSVYVAEVDRIRRITPDGIIRRIAGVGGVGYSGDGGPALGAQLSVATGSLRIAADGSIYFGQASTPAVRRIDPSGVIRTVAGTGVSAFSGDGGRPLAARFVTVRGMGVGPGGELYVSDWGARRVRRVGTPLPAFDGQEDLIASADGSQLYRFSAAGQHLESVSALTGHPLYTFDYDAENRLTSIVDADGLATTVQRTQGGQPLSITGPFGQVTSLGVDARGYLASVANPASEAHTVVADSLGLLLRFIAPKQDTTRLVYDDIGRLTQHVDAGGVVTSLARTEGQDFVEVEMTRGVRTTAYRTERLADGSRRRVLTGPAGHDFETIESTNSVTTGSTPAGTERTSTEGPDFRFGLEAPVVTQATLGLPSGLTSMLSGGRRVTLADTLNPLSLVSVLDSVVLNGRKYLSAYDAATRTLTSTTPVGRQTVSVLDSLERLVSHSVTGLQSVGFTYDGDGLLTAATQGARTWTFDYDASGRLLAATDPLSRTDSLFYDLADRVRRQVLADGDSIVYGYDANGNLTSLAPPGRPAHTFSYNAAGLDSIYDPPDVSGLSEDRTLYAYNTNRELIEITRPDGGSIDFTYDGAGRVDAVTIPRGTLDYAYSGTTGQLTSITAPGSEGLTFTYDGVLPVSETWNGTVAGTVGFAYDADLRLSGLAVNGDTIAYGYDNDGLLVQAGDLSLTRNANNGLLTQTALDSVATRTTYNTFG
jgi:YD repeat-containing protein